LRDEPKDAADLEWPLSEGMQVSALPPVWIAMIISCWSVKLLKLPSVTFVAQTVTIGEQKVCPESESLKFSTTSTPQVENPSDSDSTALLLRLVHLRPHSFETTLTWDLFIWDHIHLRSHSFYTTLKWSCFDLLCIWFFTIYLPLLCGRPEVLQGDYSFKGWVVNALAL